MDKELDGFALASSANQCIHLHSWRTSELALCEVTLAHVGSKGSDSGACGQECVGNDKSLGPCVVISIDNKHNYVPVQCNAKQVVVNEETKGDYY
jgi:hypothetical protein